MTSARAPLLNAKIIEVNERRGLLLGTLCIAQFPTDIVVCHLSTESTDKIKPSAAQSVHQSFVQTPVWKSHRTALHTGVQGEPLEHPYSAVRIEAGHAEPRQGRDDRVVGDADAISDAMAAAPVGVTAYYVDRLSKWDGEEEGERFRFATNFAKVMEVD